MGNSLSRRVDELEAVFGAADDADSTLVERDEDGRITVVAMRFAYRFNKAGAVIGVKFKKQVHDRRPDEPLFEFRNRVIWPDINVWREVLDQLPSSRGLPNFDGYEELQAAVEQRRRATAADAVRRKGETEWGERVIGLVEIMEADDAH